MPCWCGAVEPLHSEDCGFEGRRVGERAGPSWLLSGRLQNCIESSEELSASTATWRKWRRLRRRSRTSPTRRERHACTGSKGTCDKNKCHLLQSSARRRHENSCCNACAFQEIAMIALHDLIEGCPRQMLYRLPSHYDCNRSLKIADSTESEWYISNGVASSGDFRNVCMPFKFNSAASFDASLPKNATVVTVHILRQSLFFFEQLHCTHCSALTASHSLYSTARHLTALMHCTFR